MSNDIILKAPDYAYKAVDIYKAKLKKIGSFRDKFKRFFSNKNDKAKEINEIQIKLKTYGKELQELCLKYYEDKKFRDEVQKLLKICKKLFKSFGIKDDITDVGVRAYGSLIKELIPRYISLINEAIEKCKKNSEGAGEFVNKITSYYSKIRSSLAKIEYKDEHIAKLLTVFDALGMFFCRIHWENVTKSQKEVIELLVKKRTYLERMKTTLKMGRISWKEAYEGINKNVRNEEKNFDEQVEKWKKIQYFSKDIFKSYEGEGKNFFDEYWQDEILEEKERKFKCKFTFDEDTKNDIETYAKSEVSGKLSQVCTRPNIKSACEEIMENSFEELFESIKGRKTFEQSCKDVYIFNEKLDKKAIKDACSMYDVLVKGKSLGNDTSVECDYRLKDSNCESVFDCTLGKNSKDALECAKILWKSRGKVTKNKKILFFTLEKEASMRVPGAISV